MLGGSRICRILPANDSGSAGKNRNRPTRPRFYSSATCGFVGKNRVVLGGFRIFPALPENVATLSVLKRKPLRIPLRNSPLNAKTAFRRLLRTKPDVSSQGLITVGTLRKSPISVNHYPDGMTTVELNRKADLRQVKRPPYSASSNILNNALCIGIQVLHAQAKRLPIKCLIV